MKLRANKAIIISAIAITVIAAIIAACSVSSCRSRLNFSATFYYVCYDSPAAETSASSISSAVHSYGGAGYIIESGGEYYVTVSCYYNQNDARSVCEALNKKGLKCAVLEVETGDYYLNGNAKSNENLYLGNLNTLLSLSEMCYNLANSLDGFSCDQTAAKALLSDVRFGLDGLARNNSSNCFSREIAALRAECEDVAQGYVLSHDVRRLQIAITDCIVNVELY